MPQYRAVPVMLSAGERKVLKKRACGAKTACRDWLRAQIVLAAARGRASARIAADLHVSVDTVRKWRGRFAARGLDGLKELPRSGRPGPARPVVTPSAAARDGVWWQVADIGSKMSHSARNRGNIASCSFLSRLADTNSYGYGFGANTRTAS